MAKKIKKPKVVNSKSSKPTNLKTSKTSKKQEIKISLFSWREFTPMLLLLIGFLLLTIGLFTQMFSCKSYLHNITYSVDPISYFVKWAINDINIANKNGGGIITVIELIKIALIGLSWLLALIPTLIILGFTIYKVIRYTCYHDLVEFNYKSLIRWMLGFVISYILFVNLLATGYLGIYDAKDQSTPTDVQTLKLGYGPIICLCGLAFIFIANLYSTKDEFIQSKIKYIFYNLPLLILLVMSITSTSYMFKSSEMISSNETIYLSGYSLLNISIHGETKNDSLISLVSILMATIFIPLIARAKHNSTKITFSSIALLFGSGAFTHGSLLVNKTGKDLIMGYSLYFLFISISLLFALSIASSILKKIKVIE